MDLLGLRTIIYPTSDIEVDTKWWSELLGYPPYYKEDFYVGFYVAGYQLGLHPGADKSLGQQTYFGVNDVPTIIAKLKDHGCKIIVEPQDQGGGIITASAERDNGQRINVIYNPYILPNQPLKHIDD